MENFNIKEIIDNVIKEEYGGCDPRKDKICYLRARAVSEKGLAGRAIKVLVVGKWRTVGTCGYHGLPSKQTVGKAIRTLMFNTGSYDVFHTPHYHNKFNPGKGTFGGKEVVLAFEHIDNP